MKYTILGGEGFIGSNFKKYLQASSIKSFVPGRDHEFSETEDLGHVVYCIGVTSDFRSRPFDTVEAHVCKLTAVLKNTTYQSFTYLSSARVYSGSESGNEDAMLKVNSRNFNDLYNLSKLLGESICFTVPNNKVRIIRLSNVVGFDFRSNNFIYSLIKDAVDNKHIELSMPAEAAKDYVLIDDVVKAIKLIAEGGKERMYNVASGIAVSNQQLLNEIQKQTNCTVRFLNEEKDMKFPAVSIERVQKEFDFSPNLVLDHIDKLVDAYKNK